VVTFFQALLDRRRRWTTARWTSLASTSSSAVSLLLLDAAFRIEW